MKGLWKNKLGGWNSKGEYRKSQTWDDYVDDNAVYNIKNDKYVEEYDVVLFKGKRVFNAYKKLDDWNKARQFESNLVDRCVRARTREYIAQGDWDKDIKDTYGTKSIDWLVS